MRKWNAALGVILAIEGVALLLLSVPRDYPVYIAHMAADPLQSSLQHTTVTAPAIHQLFMLNATYLAAALCFIAALFHLLRVSVLRKSYEAALQQKGRVLLHPIQLAIELGIIVAMVGLLSGIHDAASFFLLFIIAVLFGFSLRLAERQGQGRPLGMTLRGLVWLSGVSVATSIALYLFADKVFGSGVSSIAYITGVLAVIMALMLMINWRFVWMGQGMWKDSRAGELWFMVLNFAGVTLLSAELFVLLLRP